MMIIQKCVKLLKNANLLDDETSSIMARIIYLLKEIDKFYFFHMLRANNHMADGQANTEVLLEQGRLCIHQNNSSCHVP